MRRLRTPRCLPPICAWLAEELEDLYGVVEAGELEAARGGEAVARADAREPAVQLGVGERGAGFGRRHEPGREVHRRAVEVALPHDHLADREPDSQFREPLARARLDQRERERARDPGAFVTNITASPIRFATLAPAAAMTSPVVASKRVSIAASSDASS